MMTKLRTKARLFKPRFLGLVFIPPFGGKFSKGGPSFLAGCLYSTERGIL
jgi:hypothetical protein